MFLSIGRGGNSWLSPEGCAMFSLHVRIELENSLGRAVSYLQHITSLAVVESVRTLPGYEVTLIATLIAARKV